MLPYTYIVCIVVFYSLQCCAHFVVSVLKLFIPCIRNVLFCVTNIQYVLQYIRFYTNMFRHNSVNYSKIDFHL